MFRNCAHGANHSKLFPSAGYHHNQGVYALSRRITRSIAPSGVTATDNYVSSACLHYPNRSAVVSPTSAPHQTVEIW